jgi:hypothetical protein
METFQHLEIHMPIKQFEHTQLQICPPNSLQKSSTYSWAVITQQLGSSLTADQWLFFGSVFLSLLGSSNMREILGEGHLHVPQA